MTTHELRASFSTRLLSMCGKTEATEYMAQLEELVKNSAYDVSPGRSWIGPRNDTLLGFLDGKLVCALCMRLVPMLDPLIFEPEDVPFAALLLNEVRLRAEGVLVGQGNSEYFFCVPSTAEKWMQAVTQMGGTESLTESGLEMFRRRL